MTETPNTITIDLKEYEALILNTLMLNALEENGVDSWDGFETSQETFNKKVSDIITQNEGVDKSE